MFCMCLVCIVLFAEFSLVFKFLLFVVCWFCLFAGSLLFSSGWCIVVLCSFGFAFASLVRC